MIFEKKANFKISSSRICSHLTTARRYFSCKDSYSKKHQQLDFSNEQHAFGREIIGISAYRIGRRLSSKSFNAKFQMLTVIGNLIKFSHKAIYVGGVGVFILKGVASFERKKGIFSSASVSFFTNVFLSI